MTVDVQHFHISAASEHDHHHHQRLHDEQATKKPKRGADSHHPQSITLEVSNHRSVAPASCAAESSAARLQGLQKCTGGTCGVLLRSGSLPVNALQPPQPPPMSVDEDRLARFCLGLQGPQGAQDLSQLLTQLSLATGAKLWCTQGSLYNGLLGGPACAGKVPWGCFLVGDDIGRVWALHLKQAAATAVPACVQFDAALKKGISNGAKADGCSTTDQQGPAKSELQNPASLKAKDADGGTQFGAVPGNGAATAGSSSGVGPGSKVWIDTSEQLNKLDGVLMFDIQEPVVSIIPCTLAPYFGAKDAAPVETRVPERIATPCNAESGPCDTLLIVGLKGRVVAVQAAAPVADARGGGCREVDRLFNELHHFSISGIELSDQQVGVRCSEHLFRTMTCRA